MRHLTKQILAFVGNFNSHKSTHNNNNNNKIRIKTKIAKKNVNFLPTQYSTRKKRELILLNK
jgi:hypothetical protein